MSVLFEIESRLGARADAITAAVRDGAATGEDEAVRHLLVALLAASIITEKASAGDVARAFAAHLVAVVDSGIAQ